MSTTWFSAISNSSRDDSATSADELCAQNSLSASSASARTSGGIATRESYPDAVIPSRRPHRQECLCHINPGRCGTDTLVCAGGGRTSPPIRRRVPDQRQAHLVSCLLAPSH